jgi:hypothetical protein
MKLGPKKDPRELLNELAAIECRYSLELTDSKKKAVVLRLGGQTYASIIATTTMIHRSKGTTLACDTLLEEMHIQWRLAGGKSKNDDKDSDKDDEVALIASTKKGGKKGGKKTTNPDADKTCNHCTKKGHVEANCWKKFPDKVPEKVKAARKKQEEKKSTAAAAVDEELVLSAIEDKTAVQFVQFDINNAYEQVPIENPDKYIKLPNADYVSQRPIVP